MNRKHRIFIWRKIETWDGFVCGLMPHGVHKQVKAAICQKQETFQYYDDSDPLKSIYSTFANYDSLGERFVKAFGDSFSHVSMFHCCRPRYIEPYYSDGIRVLSPDEANRQFADLCHDSNDLVNIPEQDIIAAIDSMSNSSGRFDQAYFGLDDRYLIEHCGHYLIYGSEYLQSLCRHLRDRIRYDLSSQLKRIGIPTVFQIKISVSQLTIQELSTLANNALPAWAYRIAHNRREPGLLNFAIMLSHDLPPTDIVTHYHPEKIPDPFFGRMVYRYKNERLNTDGKETVQRGVPPDRLRSR